MPMTPCADCKREISDQAAICPNCGAPALAKKKTSALTYGGGLLIVVLSLFALSMIMDVGYREITQSVWGTAPIVNSKPSGPVLNVTLDEYSQIETGMSYKQVRNIIGDFGQEISRSDMAGTTTVMYSWKNSNGSNMNAMFQNDKLVNKAQFGLR